MYNIVLWNRFLIKKSLLSFILDADRFAWMDLLVSLSWNDTKQENRSLFLHPKKLAASAYHCSNSTLIMLGLSRYYSPESKNFFSKNPGLLTTFLMSQIFVILLWIQQLLWKCSFTLMVVSLSVEIIGNKTGYSHLLDCCW